MATEMTQGDWREAGFAMVWAITDRASYRAFDDREYPDDDSFNKAFDAVKLNLAAPAGLADGEYRVYHKSYNGKGWGSGVTVKDGHFIPVPTENGVLCAVAQSYYVDPDEVREGKAGLDHRFIEGFRWDAESDCLEVVTGS